jgi:hypothetical protein
MTVSPTRAEAEKDFTVKSEPVTIPGPVPELAIVYAPKALLTT